MIYLVHKSSQHVEQDTMRKKEMCEFTVNSPICSKFHHALCDRLLRRKLDALADELGFVLGGADRALDVARHYQYYSTYYDKNERLVPRRNVVNPNPLIRRAPARGAHEAPEAVLADCVLPVCLQDISIQSTCLLMVLSIPESRSTKPYCQS